MEDFMTYFPLVCVYLLDMCPHLQLEQIGSQVVIYLDVTVTDFLRGNAFISVLKKEMANFIDHFFPGNRCPSFKVSH
jgi:hypothetical protein